MFYVIDLFLINTDLFQKIENNEIELNGKTDNTFTCNIGISVEVLK